MTAAWSDTVQMGSQESGVSLDCSVNGVNGGAWAECRYQHMFCADWPRLNCESVDSRLRGTVQMGVVWSLVVSLGNVRSRGQ